MALAAVGPGSSYTVPGTLVGVTGTGYEAILEVRCDFEDVLANTYHVQASVAGSYYTGGPAEDVLVVYDPSLGFTTGGGWFYWPGSTDKTKFGYTMKYNQDRDWVEPEGNHEFLAYFEDWNEPGAGHDQVWIELHDKDGNVIEVMSMDRDATNNTETLGGGNIVARP